MQVNPAPILLVHRGPQTARKLVRSLLETDPDHEFTDRPSSGTGSGRSAHPTSWRHSPTRWPAAVP